MQIKTIMIHHLKNLFLTYEIGKAEKVYHHTQFVRLRKTTHLLLMRTHTGGIPPERNFAFSNKSTTHTPSRLISKSSPGRYISNTPYGTACNGKHWRPRDQTQGIWYAHITEYYTSIKRKTHAKDFCGLRSSNF